MDRFEIIIVYIEQITVRTVIRYMLLINLKVINLELCFVCVTFINFPADDKKIIVYFYTFFEVRSD